MNFGRSLAEGMQKNLFHFLARCKVITFAQNNAMAKSGAFESIFFQNYGSQWNSINYDPNRVEIFLNAM